MRLRLLPVVLVAVALTAMVATVPLAGATQPQAVTIAIAETFNTTPPFVTGDITATGGVFGDETTGTLASVAFKPVGWAVTLPPQDHLFVYTATDRYTFGSGSFLIDFEASCNVVSVDFESGDLVLGCAGNWQVNGGAGGYARLKGTGTFTETQELDDLGEGTGAITLTGAMHIE